MANDFLQETGISAALGCATGFLWSTLAGQADLGKGQKKNNWHEKPAFNGIAFPLNYGATPLTSTLSLIMAGAGSLGNGVKGVPYFFAGTLVFPQEFCFGYYRAQLGAIGHDCSDNKLLYRQFHEVGHAVQSSILGDPGITVISGLNHIFQWNHNKLILEQWANDFSRQIDFSPYLREKFNLPKDSVIERDEFGVYRVHPPVSIIIEGRRYLPDPDLVFGTNMEGQIVLVEGTLAEPTTIDGFCFRKGARMEYNGLGGIKRVRYQGTEEQIFHFPTQRKDMPYHCESNSVSLDFQDRTQKPR